MANKAFETIGGGVNNQEVRSHIVYSVPLDAATGMALESLPQTFTYDDDGNLETITATDGTNTWVQTFTYEDGNLTAVSAWVKQ